MTEPDFRMRDAELLVRYYAFRNFLQSYRGSLKQFFDDTCKSLNEDWETKSAEIKEQAEDLEIAIEATSSIFDNNQAFRKWDGNRYQGPFNRAVFDIMVYYLVCTPSSYHS